MMYSLVTDLAADGVSVAVTCRVLKFSKQGQHRRLRRRGRGLSLLDRGLHRLGQDRDAVLVSRDQNYWLGRFNGTQIQYTLAGNTAGFGGGEGVSPFWTGDFTGSGKTETLFWYPGEGNYWLGRFSGTNLSYTFAGNS